jgi:hypothetical protein
MHGRSQPVVSKARKINFVALELRCNHGFGCTGADFTLGNACVLEEQKEAEDQDAGSSHSVY